MDTDLLAAPAFEAGDATALEADEETAAGRYTDLPPATLDDARVTELEAALSAAEAARAGAVARLRTALLERDPAIPAELVTGESVEELEESYAAARALVGRVRQAVAAAAPTVPAGAPGRTVAAPSSPLAKIRAGLGRLQPGVEGGGR